MFGRKRRNGNDNNGDVASGDGDGDVEVNADVAVAVVEYATDEGGAQGHEQQYNYPSQGSLADDGAYSEEANLADNDDSPSRLYNILMDGQPTNAERTGGGFYDSNTRERVEKTWSSVRGWFNSHPSEDERQAAAYFRGEGDQAPLHLMCKIRNPPVDCLQMLLESAMEVASWTDANGGWLPLHLACANSASPEVLELLISAYPNGKITQDHQNRTPLHFYATPLSSVFVLEELCSTGAAQLTDRGGMLPMHYACAYGTNSDVLRVLANAYGEAMVAKEQKGRTPMHLAMSNAQRGHNSGVIKFLVEYGGTEIVNMRDTDGYSPLQLLVQGLNMKSSVPSPSNKEQQEEHHKNICECLKLYLDAEPEASADFLTALQDLPDWAADVAVIQPKVRKMLNQKIIKRLHTCILMMDGYVLIILIICFEICTKIEIQNEYGQEEEQDNFVPLIILLLCVFYFIIRESVQVISLILLGNLTSWFQDSTNWLDMAVIISVSFFSVLMFNDDWAFSVPDAFRYGVAVTKGLLWLAVIYFLKAANIEFAVFVSGVIYVVKRLIYFVMAVIILLLAFAQMFFFIYFETDICVQNYTQTFFDNGTQVPNNYNDTINPTTEYNLNCPLLTGRENNINYTNPTSDGELNETFYDGYTYRSNSTGIEQFLFDPFNNSVTNFCACPIFPHCNPEISILKVYSMMMGEIGSEVRYSTSGVAQFLYVMYVFIVVILLSNVLIAIVTDLYEVIQHDRAAIVFWQNRLDFVAEMDGIAFGVKSRLQFLGCGGGGENRDDEIQNDYNREDDHDYLGSLWKNLTDFLKDDDDLLRIEEENPASCTDIYFYTSYLMYLTTIILIPIWILAGLATCGLLWPPQVRRYIFAQQEAGESRSEIERKKLEQLKHISTDINHIREEIQYEMEIDRDDIANVRADIDMFQSEVLQDLVQIKELMSTLLDNNDARPY